jgi:hypothetical protein
MSTLDDALRISQRLPVFPCKPDKRPATKRGFLDATRDPAGVVDLWRGCRATETLIGVPTGDVSGFDALDIDPRHGGDEWLTEASDRIPATRWHHTRSGGLHLLFRHADGVRNSAGRTRHRGIAPGVDVRGSGGYIIWWPAHGCRVDNQALGATWPEWLLRIMMPPKAAYRPPPMPATPQEADTRAARIINRAYDRVRRAEPGMRHWELWMAARTLGGLSRFLGRSQSDVERELVELIMATGAEDRLSAEKTARWAFDHGAREPLLGGS